MFIIFAEKTELMDTKNVGFDTKLIHGGTFDDQFGSATVPIYQTSTFRFKNAQDGADCFSGASDGYIYTRIANPTIRALEQNIAALENGFGGIATSSGMEAITSVYMALLNAGDHIISTAAVYGPARGVLEQDFARFQVEASFVNTADIEKIKKAIRPNSKVLYIETPANPTMEITDIAACAEIAREHGLVLVVDNTFCTPYLQKPLDLGADVVLHSVTKFINGHADIVGGIIITKESILYKKIRHSMVYMGCNMDPHQADLVLRGVKTLSVRLDRNQENAEDIINDLCQALEKV
jgi:methionine-gamma-lyase